MHHLSVVVVVVIVVILLLQPHHVQICHFSPYTDMPFIIIITFTIGSFTSTIDSIYRHNTDVHLALKLTQEKQKKKKILTQEKGEDVVETTNDTDNDHNNDNDNEKTISLLIIDPQVRRHCVTARTLPITLRHSPHPPTSITCPTISSVHTSAYLNITTIHYYPQPYPTVPPLTLPSSPHLPRTNFP